VSLWNYYHIYFIKIDKYHCLFLLIVQKYIQLNKYVLVITDFIVY